jgi:hypothetical protein
MNPAHQAFFTTPVGAIVAQIIDRAENHLCFRAMTAAGLPAIQAVVWEIEAAISRLPASGRKHAAQSAGARVGEIMTTVLGAKRAHSASGELKRGTLRSSGMITTGAVWEFP